VAEDEPVLIEWCELRDGDASGGPNEDTARANASFNYARRYAVIGVNYFWSRAVSTPEILEPMRPQLGVAHGVLDVLVTEPGLQRPCVVARVRQGIAAAMSQTYADASETAFWREPRSGRIARRQGG